MSGTICLVPEFTYCTSIVGPHEVGDGPQGIRQYYEMTDGVVEGERLSGRTVGTGSDWMLAGPDGFWRMDARVQIRTDDGAVILAHYHGPAEANAGLREAIRASEPTGFEDQLIRMHWLLEAGDPHYAWVNQAIFVSEGRFAPRGPGIAGFEHRVYRVG